MICSFKNYNIDKLIGVLEEVGEIKILFRRYRYHVYKER